MSVTDLISQLLCTDRADFTEEDVSANPGKAATLNRLKTLTEIDLIMIIPTAILASYGGRTCVVWTIFRRLLFSCHEHRHHHHHQPFRFYDMFKVNEFQCPCLYKMLRLGTSTLWRSSGAAVASHVRTLCAFCASFLSCRLVAEYRRANPKQQKTKQSQAPKGVHSHAQRRAIPLYRLTDSVKRPAAVITRFVTSQVATDHVASACDVTCGSLRIQEQQVHEKVADRTKFNPDKSATESRQHCIPVLPLDQQDKPILVEFVEGDKLELKQQSLVKRVSLQLLANCLQFVNVGGVLEESASTKGTHRNTKHDFEKESDKAVDFPFEEFYASRTIRLTFAAREMIALCVERKRDMNNELSRYSTFGNLNNVASTWLSPFFSASGWLLRLSEAGFYMTEQDEVFALRCAFCACVVHDMSKFVGKAPIDVHRELEPTCPFVRGQVTTNRSLSQFWQTSGRQFLQEMFRDASRPSRSYSPPDVSENLRRSSDSSEGLSAQYQLPPPRQLSEQRLTTAVASQASARHQPLSLVANASMDCHQSGPTSLKHTSSSASGVGESREQSAAPMSTYSNTQLMAENQSSLPSSLPISPARITPAQNASLQTPLTQSALPQSSVQMQIYQSAQFEPSGLNSKTQTSSQSPPTAQTAPPPARSSTQVPPHQSQAPNQTSTSPQDESSSSENRSATSNPTRQVVTYSQLGIYTQQPKRPDMVVQSIRCGTFSGWPHSRTHTPEEMAEAGFYYTGHNDLVRCFYCKGGLKSWAGHLRPWVEHARFFPECPYVSQVKGRAYIEAVQALHTESEAVSEQQVGAEMSRMNKTTHVQQNAEFTIESGASWKDEGGAVGGAVGGASEPASTDDFLRDAEPGDITKRLEELENIIYAEKEERICKVCRSNEVNILFLPCGHLVSCAHCAPALRTCAVCRQNVKGRVRVYMSEEEP